jgi:hypothetical protein
MARQLDQARKHAAHCDEALALSCAAERLGERDDQKTHEQQLAHHIQELRTIQLWNRTLFNRAYLHKRDQQSVFERLRR